MVARAAEPGGCTMARLIGVVVSAAIALLSLTFTALSPAAAETDFPYWGSYGGTTHIARCQPGQYMVSFRGRSGDLIDQIEVLCAPINNDLTYGTSTPAGHGGANGGVTFQPMGCLASEAVGGIAWMAGRDENDSGMPGYVDMFGATCRGLAPPHSRGKFLEQYSNDDPGAFANSWMRQQHELDPPGYNYDYVGKPANDTDANPAHGYGQQCPADELSVGLRFSSGAFINSIALICDTGPAELAARAAGTAGSLGDVPKPDAGINFSGKWDTNANGQKLTVTLTQDAKGYVTGTYPGGKITDGVVIGSQLRAKWTEGARSGRLRFNILNGKTLEGRYNNDATKQASLNDKPWNGVRAPAISVAAAESALAAGALGTSGGGAAAASFVGSWQTTINGSSPGTMTLSGSASSWTGSYTALGISGHVASGYISGDGHLHIVWSQPGATGKAEFHFTATNQFKGSFTIDGNPVPGSWDGHR